MNLHVPLGVAQSARGVRWLMTIAWLLIAVKCVWVWWAVNRWQMPFHPLWIVAPTIVFAGLATALWLAHRED